MLIRDLVVPTAGECDRRRAREGLEDCATQREAHDMGATDAQVCAE
jgi:hypothetical protein